MCVRQTFHHPIKGHEGQGDKNIYPSHSFCPFPLFLHSPLSFTPFFSSLFFFLLLLHAVFSLSPAALHSLILFNFLFPSFSPNPTFILLFLLHFHHFPFTFLPNFCVILHPLSSFLPSVLFLLSIFFLHPFLHSYHLLPSFPHSILPFSPIILHLYPSLSYSLGNHSPLPSPALEERHTWLRYEKSVGGNLKHLRF